MDKDEFEKMLGSEDVETKTTLLATKAEDLYRKISGMGDLTNSKGYSMGGAAANLAAYSNLDWETLDNLCAKITEGTIKSIFILKEHLKNSTDPDDAIVLRDLEEDEAAHVVRNIAYHNFWIGFLLHEVAIDEEAILPILGPNADIAWDAEVIYEAGLDQAMRALQEHIENDDLTDDDPIAGLGLSMNQCRELGQRMRTAAAMMLLLPDKKPDDLAIEEMILLTGIVIGRSLQAAGQ